MKIFLIVLICLVAVFLIQSIVLGIIFVPRPLYLDKIKHKTSTDIIRIKSGDHELYAKIIKPTDKDGKLPLVICSHGFNSSYRKCETMVCNTLSRSGYSTICFDFYNGSNRSKSGGNTLGMNIFEEKEDLRSVLYYALTLDFVDTKNIFLLGESQGSVITSLLANEVEDKINSIILFYPAFCIVDDALKNFPDRNIPETVKVFGAIVSKKYYDGVLDFDLFENATKFNKNVLVLHGTADKIVPYEYGVKVSKSYKNSKLITLDKEIHGFTAKGQMTSIKDVYKFLNDNIIK